MPETSKTDARDRRNNGDLREENLRLREELLGLRDALIGAEARLAEALGRLRIADNEVLRYQEMQRLYSSRTGRALQAYHRIRSRLRS